MDENIKQTNMADDHFIGRGAQLNVMEHVNIFQSFVEVQSINSALPSGRSLMSNSSSQLGGVCL